MQMQLGSDPEWLVRNKTSGEVRPFKQLEGEIIRSGTTSFYEDNVLVEGAHAPASSREQWIREILNLKLTINTYLNAHELELHDQVTAEFQDYQLDMCEKGRVFFCNPDFNAYTGKANPTPNPEGNLRSAGGHVHVSTELDKIKVVTALDYTLGIPSILMDSGGSERRKLYGKAGSYRPKKYGVEYRVLSNFWTVDENDIAWVWDTVERTLGDLDHYVAKSHLSDARSIIDTNDYSKAMEIVHEL